MLPNLGFYVVDGAGPGPMQELLHGKLWDYTDDLTKSKLQLEAPSFIPVPVKPVENTQGDQKVAGPPAVNPTVSFMSSSQTCKSN